MFMSHVRRFLKDESGATMVEYGIMVAVIAAVAIAIVQSIGTKTSNAFKNVDSALP
jgi:pilus assembly protein Flp/PilA